MGPGRDQMCLVLSADANRSTESTDGEWVLLKLYAINLL